ncbi:MAG TPA: hypothetical protein VIK72_08475 [Clostridiaceae bacterium]
MGSLNMDGPYDFNINSIDVNVTKVCGGNYALGIEDKITGNFHVTYVGRSDSDVKDRLKKQLSETKSITTRYETKNVSFKYSYASSQKEAFDKECYNYHGFVRSKKLTNNGHPEKPKDESWKCPVCNE